MRILQVITQNQRRGAEVFAVALSDGLAARGHSVTIASIYRCETPAFDSADVQFVELGGQSKGKLDFTAIKSLARLIRQFDADVIQANGFHALKHVVLARIVAQSRCPIVYRNISLASDWVRGRIRRAWGRWLFRHVCYVTSVSEQCANNLCKTYAFANDRALVIRRGVDFPDVLQPERARQQLLLAIGLPADDTTPILMHTGGFTVEKNQQGLLAVFKDLCQCHPSVRLVFCGDGPLLRDVRYQAQALLASGRVFFLGDRPDAAQLVAGADLFVLPSHIEGIPGVVLEAAARGIASVCTRVGGVAEAVIDGTTGILVPPEDPLAMRNAILRLLEPQGLRQQMGQAARQHMAEHFDLHRAIDRFEHLFVSMD